ncbi:MAG: DMT family transporter [Paucibacter sp.]|nr:DMT family transporter [Roseateles sp.]
MTPPSPAPLRAYVFLALSTSLVGSYVGLSKLLVAVFPVFVLAGLRFSTAAALMLPWLRAEPGVAPLDARTRGLLFLESFLGNFLFSICLLFGMRESSAAVAGVIMAGMPAAVALMSRLFLGERITPRMWLAVVCSVGGIAVVAAQRDGSAATTAQGAALLLGALLCEAAYVVIGKRLTASLSPKRISALMNLWGLVLVLPLALWQAASFDFGAPRPLDWGLSIFYAVAASIVSVWLWMLGLRHVPASRAGVFMVFLPISTALVGLCLGETMTAVQVLAYGLALAGVLLATRRQ